MPDFIERLDVSQLSDNELDRLIQERQERRLKVRREYEQLLEEKKQAQSAKWKDELDKQLRMFEKDFKMIDNALERLEKRSNKVKALRIQLEDE